MRAKVGRESERNGRESEREGRETFGEKAERQLGRRQSRSVFCLKFLILSKDLHILKSQRNILKTSHNIKMQMSGKSCLVPNKNNVRRLIMIDYCRNSVNVHLENCFWYNCIALVNKKHEIDLSSFTPWP